MKIKDTDRLTGIPAANIRYYEKEGLLPEPERTGSNYRLYDDATAERLAFSQFKSF